MSLFLSGSQQLSLQQDETHLDMKAQTFHEFSKLCPSPNVQHECVACALEEVFFLIPYNWKAYCDSVESSSTCSENKVLRGKKCIYLFI